MAEYFCRDGNSEFGPLSADELRELAASGILTPAGEVRKGRGAAWLPATNVQGLFEADPVDELAAAVADLEEPLVEVERPLPRVAIDEKERYPGLLLVSMYYKVGAVLVLVLSIFAAIAICVVAVAGGSRWPALLTPVGIAVGVAVAGVIGAIILWSIAELIRLVIDLELNARRAASGIAALLDR